MRTISLTVLLAAATPALAQPLYSNAGPDPSTPALNGSPATLSGVAAPGGFLWSEAPSGAPGECNAVAGFAGHSGAGEGAFRFADDFNVTGSGWTLQTLTVYAYQPGAAGPGSPFNGINVRIWSGAPDAPGSTIVFGDAFTNRMASSLSAGLYRAFNTVTVPLPPAPDTSRLVWATTATLGVTLVPGTYWIDWQLTSVNPNAAAYSPPATIGGSRGQPAWNALQFRPDAGVLVSGWFPLVDAGKPWAATDFPQDLPFLLGGTAVNTCDPDYNQDGNTDQDDVTYLLNVVAGGENPTGRDPDFNQDGNADQDDYTALIAVIAGGPCP